MTPALSAEGLVLSIGVNTHMWYGYPSYSHLTIVENSLAYLGVHYLRDEDIGPQVQPAFQPLLALGYKFDFIASTNIGDFVGAVAAIEKTYHGGVAAIEGPNEVNIWPVTYNGGSSPANAAEYQEALYKAVRGDPSLQGVPVYDLTLAGTDAAQYKQLGNLSAFANDGNVHPYVNSASGPGPQLAAMLPSARLDTPGLPVVITETGYDTDPNDAFSGTDQIVQAKYTLDTLLDAYKDGVAHTYLYELLDDAPDPSNTNRQDHFGLFNVDGTPKLAATAIHDLTTILGDPHAGSSFKPGGLAYSVSNLPSDGHQMLLEKSNGAFDLVLWAEPSLWSPDTHTETAASTETVTIKFGQEENVTIFDPLAGTSPISIYDDVRSLHVPLTDHPIVVEVHSLHHGYFF